MSARMFHDHDFLKEAGQYNPHRCLEGRDIKGVQEVSTLAPTIHLQVNIDLGRCSFNSIQWLKRSRSLFISTVTYRDEHPKLVGSCAPYQTHHYSRDSEKLHNMPQVPSLLGRKYRDRTLTLRAACGRS